MNVPFLRLDLRLAALRPELDRAIADVVDEGRFVFGPRVEEFERSFAAYCGDGLACASVGSGTDAIELGLRALGVERGDEVVTAANTCVPTVSGIESAGAVPVLVDADPVSWTIDPTRIERALTSRTRAIVPVHLYGRCADMDAINEIALAHDLRVLEDAAQAHGASYRGARAGALGDAAAFSFYPTKNLGALGDAGAIVSRDPAVVERARMLRSYGEVERYVSRAHGRNSRLDAIQAAVLQVRLEHLDRENDARRRLARQLLDALDGAGASLPVPDEGHAWHLFVVRVRERDAVRARLAADGVETLVHYPRAVHQHPAYLSLAHDDLRTSELLAAEVLSLPLHPDLDEDAVSHVAAALRRATG